MAFTSGWFYKVIHSRVRVQAMAKLPVQVVMPVTDPLGRNTFILLVF